MYDNLGHYALPGLAEKVTKARLLADESEVHLGPFWNSEARGKGFRETGRPAHELGIALCQDFPAPRSPGFRYSNQLTVTQSCV